MNEDFAALEKVIKNRRTTKPSRMNGQKIPKEQVEALVGLADWAPTHGRTEPWRFLIFEGEAFVHLSKQHAELYKKTTPDNKFRQDKYEKYRKNGNTASHLIVVVMKRTEQTKIPEIEEYAAVAAAVENILLGAKALGLAAMWSTGGMATKPEMKPLLHLSAEDTVVGFVYLGCSDSEDFQGSRKIPLSEKIIWHHKKP